MTIVYKGWILSLETLPTKDPIQPLDVRRSAGCAVRDRNRLPSRYSHHSHKHTKRAARLNHQKTTCLTDRNRRLHFGYLSCKNLYCYGNRDAKACEEPSMLNGNGDLVWSSSDKSHFVHTPILV